MVITVAPGCRRGLEAAAPGLGEGERAAAVEAVEVESGRTTKALRRCALSMSVRVTQEILAGSMTARTAERPSR